MPAKGKKKNSDSVIEKRTEDLQNPADNKDEQPVQLKVAVKIKNSFQQDRDKLKDFVDSETVRRIIVKEELDKEKKAKEELNKDKKVKEELNKDKKVTEVSNGITGTIEDVKGELKEDFLLLKRDIKILTGTQQIHDNKYITYSETIFFLIAGLILEPLIIFLLYKYLPWRSSASNHDPDAHVHDGQSAQAQVHIEQHRNRWNTPRGMNILDKICSGNLEESICILSFYEETEDLHHRIITSALQQKDVPMKPFLLKVADPDALSIPRCRFVFVFVDFNERNVILENPGQELGDKKSSDCQGLSENGR
ncbi:unnamed protein product [Mytilus edulis]|uniref:Uncharacterized protein n=1 Tax=Mytilus edulis TaxID=6550 RepID=A0A8S3RHV8_MYTED|nr:unnamed protein product [Mytilus edulis]